jgi:hypothetical protein
MNFDCCQKRISRLVCKPVSGEDISITAPPPKDPLWDWFVKNIEQQDS